MDNQPPTGIESEVCADIAARQRKGIQKYGMTVADNPLGHRGWLQHTYEECLDQAIYLKRAISELDGPVRLCCGQRHMSPECPDGKVMCCLCFKRVEQSELNTTADGKKEDACIECAAKEKAILNERP